MRVYVGICHIHHLLGSCAVEYLPHILIGINKLKYGICTILFTTTALVIQYFLDGSFKFINTITLIRQWKVALIAEMLASFCDGKLIWSKASSNDLAQDHASKAPTMPESSRLQVSPWYRSCIPHGDACTEINCSGPLSSSLDGTRWSSCA